MKLNVQVTMKGRAPVVSNCRKSSRTGKFALTIDRPDIDAVTLNLANAYNHSTMLIGKYLTDDEKLHLGVPLARYEGGHDSPQPCDWGGNSETSTEVSLLGDSSPFGMSEKNDFATPCSFHHPPKNIKKVFWPSRVSQDFF